MHEDAEQCLRAVRAKDARFDGWFFTAVRTTGIYCRPSCPAVPPKVKNIEFHPTAASAQAAGFRACKRCRPDASPGSPEWDVRGDLVARAVRHISDGVVDREGVPGLARRLGYSRRQLERSLLAELGAGPLGVARAQRAQTARLLIETTGLALADVAFAAGFGSVRQFNDTVREVFAATPKELRAKAKPGTPAKGTVTVRLPFRRPLFPDNLFGHLVATAVPGVEEWRDGAYRRTLRLPHGHGTVALAPTPEYISCTLRLQDMRDLSAAIARCRRLLDLDADPVAIDAQLSEDPQLEPLVRKAPGRRVPRTVDAHELAVRAVLGQQVSTAAGRTLAGRLVTALGDPVEDDTLTHLFPTAEQLLDAGDHLAMPQSRRDTVLRLAAALASGDLDLDPGADRGEARARLAALKGIGPWTVETVAMRALGDPDAFLPTDLGITQALKALGPVEPDRWRPWRAYAVQHLWALGDHPINQMPGGTS
ncbi:MAG: AraC family transcriptional regulator [Frankiales bacterium]|jgi:AraC family transcriptional regulator of adaptative response / DNA-3-methyladenine glycosylase II|nr:AraC family transcriptional regulator [Frankiales bacterium]